MFVMDKKCKSRDKYVQIYKICNKENDDGSNSVRLRTKSKDMFLGRSQDKTERSLTKVV